MHHIAVLDDVILAFDTQLAGILGTVFTTVFNEIIIVYGFGTNEAALEISVDDAGGLRCGSPDLHGPRAHLFRSTAPPPQRDREASIRLLFASCLLSRPMASPRRSRVGR